MTRYGPPRDDFKEQLPQVRDNTLRNFHLNGGKLAPGRLRKLAEDLKTNTSVDRIDLCFCELGDADAIALAEALKVNHSVVKLRLAGNHISNKGAKALAEALEVNHGLGTLELWQNNIDDEGGVALAQALRKNTTLRELQLSHQIYRGPDKGIGDVTGIAFAEALKHNRTLAELGLANNQMGIPTAEKMAEMLKENHTLATLDIQNSKLGYNGQLVLAEALKSNRGLVSLELEGNGESTELLQAISHAVAENKNILKVYECGRSPEPEYSKLNKVFDRNRKMAESLGKKLARGAELSATDCENIRDRLPAIASVAWSRCNMAPEDMTAAVAKAREQAKAFSIEIGDVPPMLPVLKETQERSAGESTHVKHANRKSGKLSI